jgi:hypothetical protein
MNQNISDGENFTSVNVRFIPMKNLNTANEISMSLYMNENHKKIKKFQKEKKASIF